jgi:hypothetical protein
MRRALWIAAVVVALSASAAVAAAEKPDVPAIRSALKTRLAAQHLRVRHVFCIVNGRSYLRHPIVRCNVDFGEPHITAYCSVLIGGRLLTQFDVKAIPCHRDSAGDEDIIVSSS